MRQPWCIGLHWFQLYDHSPIGRPDGENYNVGFLDTSNGPYSELLSSAQLSHERMYDLARREVLPVDERVTYFQRW